MGKQGHSTAKMPIRELGVLLTLLMIPTLRSSAWADEGKAIQRCPQHFAGFFSRGKLPVEAKKFDFDVDMAANWNQLGKIPAASYPLPDGSHIVAISLHPAVLSQNPILRRIVYDYFEKFAQVTNRRLSIFKSSPLPEIYRPSKEDKLVNRRSILILNTSGPIGSTNFQVNQGMRIVFSRNQHEKLPLHFSKAFNDAEVVPGTMEFGRLANFEGSEERSQQYRSAAVIRAGVQLSLQNPEATITNVHTSRTHTVLYRRITGVVPEINIKDDENYHLQYDGPMRQLMLGNLDRRLGLQQQEDSLPERRSTAVAVKQ